MNPSGPGIFSVKVLKLTVRAYPCLLESVSVVWVFLGICPFYLSNLWYAQLFIVFHYNLLWLFMVFHYNLFYFHKVIGDVLSSMLDFINLIVLSLFFLVSVTKGLSILLIFSKNSNTFLLIFLFTLSFMSTVILFPF